MPTMITDPQHALRLGGLELVEDEATALATKGWAVSVMATDTDWGNPVPIVQRITSWLQDGWLASVTGQENRELPIQIRLRGNSARDLAAGEQAVMAELYRPNELTWQPPDILGDPCVFEIATSSLEQSPGGFDDMAELRRERIYRTKLTALPWVRSTVLTTVAIPAPPISTPTVTLVDNCSAVTNWAANYGALSTDGSSVIVSSTASPADGKTLRRRLTRTSLNIAMGSSRYLRIYHARQFVDGPPYAASVKFLVNGVELSPAMESPGATWLDCAGIATLNSLQAELTVTTDWALYPEITSAVLQFSIADLSRSTAASNTGGTGRQSSRTVVVKGAVRTPATLPIRSATAGLGIVLAHSRPAALGLASPDLQAKRTSGPTATTDANAVTGARTSLATQHEFTLPADQVAEAEHSLVALVRCTSTATRTITWATRWKMGSTTSPDIATRSVAIAFAANVWTVVRLGSTKLPPRGIGSAGSVLIRMIANGALDLDEAWIFDVENGCTTIVDCGSGTPTPGSIHSRLWIDAPTIQTNGRPRLQAGTAADRSDMLAMSDGALSDDVHEFVPGLNALHLVTTGATNATADLAYYRRAHTSILDDH